MKPPVAKESHRVEGQPYCCQLQRRDLFANRSTKLRSVVRTTDVGQSVAKSEVGIAMVEHLEFTCSFEATMRSHNKDMESAMDVLRGIACLVHPMAMECEVIVNSNHKQAMDNSTAVVVIACTFAANRHRKDQAPQSLNLSYYQVPFVLQLY